MEYGCIILHQALHADYLIDLFEFSAVDDGDLRLGSSRVASLGLDLLYNIFSFQDYHVIECQTIKPRITCLELAENSFSSIPMCVDLPLPKTT